MTEKGGFMQTQIQTQTWTWTDTHAHLDKLPDPEAALDEARAAGVKRILTIGTERADWPEVVKLSRRFSHVFGALGMHPHNGADFNQESETFLRSKLSSESSLVAVGEIGLDYHYERSPRAAQQDAFRRQLSLAEDCGLPVEIHTREAEKDTLSMLRPFRGRVRGLLHCFSGSYETAKAALDLGFNISFSGILTFKNAKALQEVCRKIPLDRLHIETDAPYLSPHPHRGKENRPARLILTAQKVAALHDITEEKLSLQLEKNTLDMFPRIPRA